MANSHGTVLGYRDHRRAGERPCEACRIRWAEHMRDIDYNTKRYRAALAVLRRRHEDEYQDILREVTEDIVTATTEPSTPYPTLEELPHNREEMERSLRQD